MTARIEMSPWPDLMVNRSKSISPVKDRLLGEILRSIRLLNDEQVQQIARHQTEHRLRFGQSAVALRFVTGADVAWALSQQVQYNWVSAGNLLANDELVMACDPFGTSAEVFRDLRAQVMGDSKVGRRPIAVISPCSGDGRSSVAANLAIAFSQLGANTLLLDADMRNPRLGPLFGITTSVGLSTILSERGSSGVVQGVVDLPGLHVLAAGATPPNPLELLHQPSLQLLLDELVAAFDYVVVDTPAAERGADARVIAATCGAALAVGRKGKTNMSAMRDMIATVTRMNARVTGVVINDF